MIEIKQLQFFAACVEEGSFSRAAEVLYTSQPNVSKIIRELEQEIGMPLFERKGRGVEPTEDGRNLYQHAHEMLLKEDSIDNLINSRRQDSLRICFNHSRSMAQALSDYLKNHEGGINIKAREGDTDMVVRDVEHFRSDLGFTFIIEKQLPAFSYNLERRGLKFTVLRSDKLQISTGPKNKLRMMRTVRLNELSAQKFVRHSDDFFSLENGLCQIEPRLKPLMDSAVMSNSVQLVINLINEGYCNVSVPTFYHTKLAEGVGQVMIDPPVTAHFVCIYRYEPSGAAKDFIKFLRAQDKGGRASEVSAG